MTVFPPSLQPLSLTALSTRNAALDVCKRRRIEIICAQILLGKKRRHPHIMDEPSSQLHLEIRDAVVRALATRRPILHHLNADTSWLLQIPRPANAVKHGARIYYNILIDPWFVGGQSDVAKWFSQQWHATESAVKSISEVEELARQVEILAGGFRPGKSRKRKVEAIEDEESYVDCVAISHEFTDHCHKETLLEVHGDVPVFATEVRTFFSPYAVSKEEEEKS